MYTLTIIDKGGFSCYTTTTMDELVDTGDTYNIVCGGTEMWLAKANTTVDPRYIYYKDDRVEVYIEEID